jgi:hypothetical protein
VTLAPALRPALGLVAAVAMCVALAGQAAAADDGDAIASQPPDGATDWSSWAADAAAEAEATDWAAVSRAAGCVLTGVQVQGVVDPVANAAMGAPADLEVTVVERTEECDGAPAARGLTLEGTAAEAAGGCASTHGPGTVCLGRSGSYVTTSWRYTGSGTIDAYLRLYRVPSTSGCPTGTAVGSSATQTYTNGTQRSLSVSSPTVQGYSAHVWRYVALGSYTDWGAACGVV